MLINSKEPDSDKRNKITEKVQLKLLGWTN